MGINATMKTEIEKIKENLHPLTLSKFYNVNISTEELLQMDLCEEDRIYLMSEEGKKTAMD